MVQVINRLSVQVKMFVVLAVGLIGFIIYFSTNYIILNTNRESLEILVTEKMPAIELCDEITNSIEKIHESASEMSESPNYDGISKLDKAHKIIVEGFKKWTELKLQNPDVVEKIHKNYEKQYEKLNDAIQNMVAGVTGKSNARAEIKAALFDINQINNEIGTLKSKINEELHSAVDQANVMSRLAMGVGTFILIFAFLATIFSFVILKGINGSLLSTNSTLQKTSRNLLNMVEEALLSAGQMRDTSNRQASYSTETVVSMEQIKRLLSQTARSASTAVKLSEASFEEANRGKDIIQGLKDAMTEIDRSNTALEEVNQAVKMIRDKTIVINEIVFKTQMLSFNANIEAARAGEHGLGFAVVANEMGSLADMSGKAAQQINELLDKSTEQVERTVTSTKVRISNANDLSAKCYEFFKILTDRSGELKTMVDSISAAAVEQNSGVEYVVKAMSELSNSSAETDRLAQGISTLANSLKTHAVSLASAVESLNTLVSGRNRKRHEASVDDDFDPSGKPLKPDLKVVKKTA